jgi:signal transduction histidine kinase
MLYTLERQISFILLLAILILIGIGGFAFYNNYWVQENLKWEKHTQDVLLELDETLLFTVDTETDARGFIITGRTEFLDSYKASRAKAIENLPQLRNLINDNLEQITRTDTLETQIGEKLNHLDKAVQMRQNEGLEEVIKTMGNGQGKALMDKVRQSAQEIKEAENDLLKRRETALTENLRSAFIFLLSSILIGIVMLALAEYVVLREIGKRQRAETQLKEANKDLEKRVTERTRQLSESELFSRTILNSLSANIAVLDKAANIVAVNDAWEDFAKSNTSAQQLPATGVGQNYLAVCASDLDETLQAVAEKLKPVLDGKSDGFSLEYPCHSPTEERWFLMQVSPFHGVAGGAVVSHNNITERKKAESELEKLFLSEQSARREAEIANRLRDEFMATVSHELRTPLNAILGWARLLKQGKLNEETAQKAIETIIRSSETQNRLIEDLLDVAKIVSGKLHLEKIEIAPDDLVNNALATVKPSADAKSIAINLNSDGNRDEKRISGDPNRLQQVVWNLLANAIKFTPEGGSIVVDLTTGDGFTEIKVTDSGIGIKDEFLPFVFERFRQDAANIRRSGGLGLGLAIVRHLTEMHGGMVSAASEGENKGSTFTVKLPTISKADV